MTDLEFMLEMLNTNKIDNLDEIQLKFVSYGFISGYNIGQCKCENQFSKEKYELIRKYEDKISYLLSIIKNI